MAPISHVDRNIFSLPSGTALKKKGIVVSKRSITIMTDRQNFDNFEVDLEKFGTEEDKRVVYSDSVQSFLADSSRFAKAKKIRLGEMQDEVAMYAKTIVSEPEAVLFAIVVANVDKAKRAFSAQEKKKAKDEFLVSMMALFDNDQTKMDEFMILFAGVEAGLKSSFIPCEDA
jgi:hypothetical protein